MEVGQLIELLQKTRQSALGPIPVITANRKERPLSAFFELSFAVQRTRLQDKVERWRTSNLRTQSARFSFIPPQSLGSRSFLFGSVF